MTLKSWRSLCTARLPKLERHSLRNANDLAGRGRGQQSCFVEEVTEEEIAMMVVSAWTGIPVSKLVECEREKAA